ncbi:FUN14 domain-containing protein 1 [Linnemannia zychae]|nr:FUN14 domain-containing protein 1 [Linnemannia zychae]
MLRTAVHHIPVAGPSALRQQVALHQHRFASTTSAFQKPSIFQKTAVSSAFRSVAAEGTASRTMIGAGSATTCLFGPLIYSRIMVATETQPSYFAPRVAHCAAATTNARAYASVDDYKAKKDPLINSKELTFGMAMGLCSGYLFKKLGKLMMLVIGLGFVSLQLLVNSQYVTVNWSKIESKFVDRFDVDRDGKVTVNDAKHGFRWLMNILTRNFQFKATYVTGFVLGFKHG